MSLVFLLVAALAAFVALRGSVRTGALILFGNTFLVPLNLPLAHVPNFLPLSRLVLWAFATGLIIKARHGEIDLAAFRPRRAQLAVVIFLLIAFVNGVALSRVQNNLVDASLTWLSLFDELLFFTCAIVVCRVLGVWNVVRMVTVFALGTALIATWEHFGSLDYAKWWFQTAHAGPGAPIYSLSVRGGERRVQGPFQFALEFGWVATMLLPITIAAAARTKRLVIGLTPGLLSIAIVWSVTRSAPAGMAAAIVVMLLVSRFDRRVVTVAVLGGLAAGVLLLGNGTLTDPFHEAGGDSAASRSRRLAVVTHEVERDPYTGLGLAGLHDRNIPGTDSSYSLVYAALGAVGAVGFGVMLVTVLGSVGGGLLHPDPNRRLLVGAAFGALIAGAVGDFAMNIFFVPGSARTYWLIAGIGLVAGETGRVAVGRTLSPARVFAPVVGLAIGLAIAFIVPSHSAGNYQFETIGIKEQLGLPASASFGGRFRINTSCELIAVVAPDGTTVECFDPRTAPGVGQLRLTAESNAAVERAADSIQTTVAGVVPEFKLHLVDGGRGKPTWATTAPVTGALAALLLALLCPPLRFGGLFGPWVDEIRGDDRRELQPV